MSDLIARFGLSPIVNGNGSVTRLSGGIMAEEVAQAMLAASRLTFDMWDLHAAACRVITRATGAEAGIVTAGASAAVLLGAAWRASLQAIADAARPPPGRSLAITDDEVPLLAITDPDATALRARLAAHTPPIHMRHVGNRLLLSPLALAPDAAGVIAAAISA
jgi:L-seryl-tRNA(Ser) seleniumtransferase